MNLFNWMKPWGTVSFQFRHDLCFSLISLCLCLLTTEWAIWRFHFWFWWMINIFLFEIIINQSYSHTGFLIIKFCAVIIHCTQYIVIRCQGLLTCLNFVGLTGEWSAFPSDLCKLKFVQHCHLVSWSIMTDAAFHPYTYINAQVSWLWIKSLRYI